MAKFKVGEQAVFRHGPFTHDEIPLRDKQVVTIRSIEERQQEFDHISKRRYPGGVWYRVEEARTWQIHEDQLEKLLFNHQPDDLRVAEPLFIQHQLPRLLGRKEKVSEFEKQ